MDLNDIKDWLVPISTCVTLITGSIAGWLSLKELRLKAGAERRLAESARIESDIQLLQTFTQLMNIANARGGYHVSDKAVEVLLGPHLKSSPSAAEVRELLQSTVIPMPVGEAQQDAAIAAIWALGKEHPVLRPSALRALQSLATFKKAVAAPYLEQLQHLESSDLVGTR